MHRQTYLGGHRGMGCTDHFFYSKRALDVLPVENTVESVLTAFAHGADYVEIDAVLSADERLFAIHNVVPEDHFFSKERPHAPLNSLPFDEIQRYRTGRLGRGIVRPLVEMFDAIADSDPQTLPWGVNIEIKGVQGSGRPYETNRYIELLAQDVCRSRLSPTRVLWSSFSLQNVLRVSHLLPNSHFGMLFSEKPEPRAIYTDHTDDLRYQYLPFKDEFVDGVASTFREAAHPSARLAYLHPEVTTITEDLLSGARNAGMGINSWALFEELNQSRIELYRSLIARTSELAIPFSIITDYLDDCVVLKNSD